jgi:hypothetical protein
MMSLKPMWWLRWRPLGYVGAGLHTRPIGRNPAMTWDLPSAPQCAASDSPYAPGQSHRGTRDPRVEQEIAEGVRYTFWTFGGTALHQDVYVYHCATSPVGMRIANGMYGLW